MPAHRARRSLAVLDEYLPPPARIVLILVVLALGLVMAGSTWPPLPDASTPAGVVMITPDDPAAPTSMPARDLGR